MTGAIEVSYREAGLGDGAMLLQMRIAFLEDYTGGLSPEQQAAIHIQYKDYLSRHLGIDYFAWLAEADGEVVAAVCLLFAEKPANLRSINGHFATVVNVYTDPKHRRQGHALQLCRLAIGRAQELKVTCLDLQATVAGRPLYEKLGFVDHVTSCTDMLMQFDANGALIPSPPSPAPPTCSC